MDILLNLKNSLDAVLWESLDRRILLSLLRLASIFIDSAILLHMGARLMRPVRPFHQWLLVIAGTAVAVATPLDGLSHVRRGLLLWILLPTGVVLLCAPGLIAKSLTPSLPGRARLERILYCFVAGTLLAQLVATWLS